MPARARPTSPHVSIYRWQIGNSLSILHRATGIALALAIYSMILQQRQNAEFEQKTLAAMAQQAEALGLIKTSLVQQANVARVTALTYLIEREEQRIETLKEWGLQSHKDATIIAHPL